MLYYHSSIIYVSLELTWAKKNVVMVCWIIMIESIHVVGLFSVGDKFGSTPLPGCWWRPPPGWHETFLGSGIPKWTLICHCYWVAGRSKVWFFVCWTFDSCSARATLEDDGRWFWSQCLKKPAPKWLAEKNTSYQVILLVTFWSPRRSLHHPKKVTKNCQVDNLW